MRTYIVYGICRGLGGKGCQNYVEFASGLLFAHCDYLVIVRSMYQH